MLLLSALADSRFSLEYFADIHLAPSEEECLWVAVLPCENLTVV
uniref:Uncharacterized protein n=1 Tax=Anguilla anguilla TaxID=7936 RepID=A0A0E9WNH3_ANGAN